MATALPHRHPDDSQATARRSVRATGDDQTGIKRVPASRGLRERIREQVGAVAAGLDKSRPLSPDWLRRYAEEVLAKLNQPEAYLGWTMVALGSAFWHDQVAAVPHRRRLLLLPHCMRDSASCPAEYNEFGLLCRDCGACELTELRTEAQRLGYHVLIAEGSPTVMQIILSGQVDAILGIACLDVLERSLEKILGAGIPCMAVPLWASRCKDSRTDLDWVREMIATPHTPAAEHTRTYVHLMRHARAMFEPARLVELLPPRRKFEVAEVTEDIDRLGQDPLSSTEAIAYDFLGQGGKYARPFVTLAAYDAMRRDGSSRCTGPNGAAQVAQLPEAIQRIAAAIEIFHKASLVHDDIEDDDAFRYGEPTLHRRFGLENALNVGDFLIGWGYRVVASETAALGADVTADILAHLSECHTRLCEGQGAELAWRATPGKTLLPLDALKIYALKTAPAFEAALLAGLRMAGPIGRLREPIGRFARHLGVAFQILNDLDDWQQDQPNKICQGTDLFGRRPTLLWAIALGKLDEPALGRLEELRNCPSAESLAEVVQLYRESGVFDQANALVDKHYGRARQIAHDMEPSELGDLLHYLADAILQR